MRIATDISENWRFMKLPDNGDTAADDVTAVRYNDSEWESVDLPHTYNAVDGVFGRSGACEGDENYYRGKVCYRKHLFLSAEDIEDKRNFIEFGAANTTAGLYVNGSFAGSHEGGYSLFRFDITELLVPDSENIFSVIVSNAPTTYIAPITDQGDFTKMGGLYRSVRLISVPAAHIALCDCGSSGVYITPVNITENSCDLNIRVLLEAAGKTPEEMTVCAAIYDENEKIGEAAAQVGFADNSEVCLSVHIDNVRLWQGRRDPYLYRAEIKLCDNGNVIDNVRETFGVRTYRIDPEHGFFLNWKHLDLHGVNYHQDSYENGWAMTDEQRRRDYGLMCELGCTAVRMAHYQHDANEYALCDRLGLCVWTEIGIVNRMAAGDDLKIDGRFAGNARQQLRELIRQNYNHPSIIVWGISNELHQMNDEIFALYKELNELANTEDITRLKTFADAQFWGKFLELPGDVVGYNRYFGWYHDAGPADMFGEWCDRYHAEKESRPICISEYGGGGAITQHKDCIDWQNDIDPWGERHYENYQSELHEKVWQQFAVRDYLWAKFVWCMFDFASCGRVEGDTVGQNDKGLMTRERIPKDAYFFYKSVWSSDPVLHICDKRFSPRACDVPQIKVYCNTGSCELIVNGKSFGTIHREELPKESRTVFVWKNIRLEKGVNSIKATAVSGSGTLTDTAEWEAI